MHDILQEKNSKLFGSLYYNQWYVVLLYILPDFAFKALLKMCYENKS